MQNTVSAPAAFSGLISQDRFLRVSRNSAPYHKAPPPSTGSFLPVAMCLETSHVSRAVPGFLRCFASHALSEPAGHEGSAQGHEGKSAKTAENRPPGWIDVDPDPHVDRCGWRNPNPNALGLGFRHPHRSTYQSTYPRMRIGISSSTSHPHRIHIASIISPPYMRVVLWSPSCGAMRVTESQPSCRAMRVTKSQPSSTLMH